MRIIGGRHRGRRLLKPSKDVRPTTDRLREALFNVLGPAVEGTVWLDAFAGTGAVGLEALSRGASTVVFNDRSAQAVDLIRRNLRHCGIEGGFEIHQLDALTLLNRLRGRRFDYAIFDPPYSFTRYDKLLAKVREVFPEPPTVILEIFKKTKIDFPGSHWRVARTVKAGDSWLLVLVAADGLERTE